MKTKNNIPPKRGFDIPQDYFNTSREMILDQLDLDKNISSVKSSPYGVPDDYFAQSKVQILDAVFKDQNNKSPLASDKVKVIHLKTYFYSIAGVAAALLLLVSILWTQPDITSTIESSDIAAYIGNETGNLENIEFEDWLTNDDIDALQNNIALDDSVIIDYLDDHTDSYHFYID